MKASNYGHLKYRICHVTHFSPQKEFYVEILCTNFDLDILRSKGAPHLNLAQLQSNYRYLGEEKKYTINRWQAIISYLLNLIATNVLELTIEWFVSGKWKIH